MNFLNFDRICSFYFIIKFISIFKTKITTFKLENKILQKFWNYANKYDVNIKI